MKVRLEAIESPQIIKALQTAARTGGQVQIFGSSPNSKLLSDSFDLPN